MKDVIGALGQLAVDRNEVLDAADLAGQDDLFTAQTHFFSTFGRINGRGNQRFVHDLLSLPRRGACIVFVHQAGQQLLVQAAPVDADAHGLVPAHGGFDHQAKLGVALIALADIAGVDTVLGQGLRAVRVIGQQAVAVVMKVADQRHVNAHAVELFAHIRHSGSGFRRIDRDANHFRARNGQFLDLNGGAQGIDRIGVGHGLNAYRRITTDGDNARTPDHLRLNGAAIFWKSGLNGQTGLHYFTSNRAMLFFDTAARSKAWPRT